MVKALVIVESPAKAKTINKYLGNDYVVKSSIGHIRDLPINNSTSKNSAIKPKQGKQNQQSALVNRMGIDPYNDWLAHYEILPGKEKIVNELKAIAEQAEHIYLATDLDREGEAIAWHIREVIGGDQTRFSRVVFNEITYNTITQAFKKPTELNLYRVNAQQARRFMDRMVGYMVSPLLWKRIARGLSAGRVQSVAVRLIVEREREIKTFLPEEYWELYANLQTHNGAPLTMRVTHQHHKLFKPINYTQIQTVIPLLEIARYLICKQENKITSSKPGAPFITSTLQQAASTHLGYGVKRTMMLAQRLYEAGYITYIRTDSTQVSEDALNMVRSYIIDVFGSEYLPNKPNQYVSKGQTQEAHEAIRPSDIYTQAQQLKNMDEQARNIYQLIWKQFVACQMIPAQYDSTILTVTAGDFQLCARGRTLRVDGWTKVMPVSVLRKENEDKILPLVEVGQILTLQQLIPSQNFSKPPARYSEASLVKKLEKLRIGRPSTYMSILSSIQNRGYVNIENRRFYAEKMGEIVTKSLEENFCELMNYDFTANMENTLDKIANNKQEWKNVLDTFFVKLIKQLEKAEKDPAEGGMQPNNMVITNIICPICSRKMGIRTASTGVFLSCSGYALPLKERCKKTMNLISESESMKILESDNTDTNVSRVRPHCIKCNQIMDSYLIDQYRKLHVCGSNPLCDSYHIEQGKFYIKSYHGPKCEKCGTNMHLKLGRFGKYVACINDQCKNTRNILSNGDIAPPKIDPVALPELICNHANAYFVLRHGATGVFLAAHTFPKVRETRAPLVEELVKFKDRLPNVLRYLADAPAQDEEGNKTLVRFSRKTKQQYVSSEKDGKATGWTAFFIDGHWQIKPISRSGA
ncbi:type I DNA topoisomerase [Candidatus Palibaumannia cicadellinicola]|uniref:DNA topoisomerase 1 n=1 Tax=Candidatus Palibaumannia cicadellinicola TaxID=186490 RepID=A0A088N1L3_9GAMM|nr:type I DNA topoisomerase [Candidatus Baumannia cicadellinicola]AIN47221.1 DNA topoisomerase I [Candidatus Baumannia cicadellinicola]